MDRIHTSALGLTVRHVPGVLKSDEFASSTRQQPAAAL